MTDKMTSHPHYEYVGRQKRLRECVACLERDFDEWVHLEVTDKSKACIRLTLELARYQLAHTEEWLLKHWEEALYGKDSRIGERRSFLHGSIAQAVDLAVKQFDPIREAYGEVEDAFAPKPKNKKTTGSSKKGKRT